MPPTCEIVVGRLVEIDMKEGFVSAEDLGAFIRRVASVLRSVSPKRRVILVADWRRYQVSRADVANQMFTLMQRGSPDVERNAMLISPNQATAVLQLRRLAVEAANSERRLFSSSFDLCEWVSEVLNSEEQSRMRKFLGI